jgi:hypothetical protein
MRNFSNISVAVFGIAGDYFIINLGVTIASKGIEIHMFGTISKENTRILCVVSIEIIWL